MAAIVPPVDSGSTPSTSIATLTEKFQKFIASQPHAMSASSHIGLPSSSTLGISSSIWVLDSGASHHMSPNSNSFFSIKSAPSVSVMTADGTPMPLAGIGSICTPKMSFSNDPYSKKLIGTGPSSVDLSSFRLSSSSSSFYLWHSRLGHVSGSRLKYLASTEALGKLQTHDISDCCGCKLAKFSALPFYKSVSVSLVPFDLIHSDVWGPSPVLTKGGSHGTLHQTSCIDTPEQNGVAERKHRHIVETARSLLLSAYVPSEFWGEAILTAVHSINRILSSVTSGLSPFEKLYGHAPDYSSLRIFGSTCFVLRPHVERSKLTSRSALYVFLGYGEFQKGYRCYDPVSQKLYVSRHVVFLEHIPFYSIPLDTPNLHKSDLTRIDPFDSCTVDTLNSADVGSQPVEVPSVPTTAQDASEIVDPAPPPRYPQRIRKSTQLLDFVYSTYSDSFSSFLTSIHQLSEPSSYKDVILYPLWQ
ncbi:uncharacterized protein LOC133795958 [Humulus lupulus]|uniref:uncharacterized protein LOC133795958 n=1 Tax=Humulus lupulus TaxID=3486 RepID=UPI002B40ADA5|nr:uncharacterized protein LOC133795958 [Humulus lupulus]